MSKTIITISREFGSGGRSIGKSVAEALEIPYYDKELIKQVAEKTGFAPEYVENAGEYAPGKSILAYFAAFSGRADVMGGMNASDFLWCMQRQVILDLVEKGSCVIVGRCADYILKDNPDAFHIFVHAAPAFRAAIKSTRFPRFLSGIHHILFNVSQLTEPSADFGSCRHTFLRRHKCQAALCVLCAENHTLRHHACQLGRL